MIYRVTQQPIFEENEELLANPKFADCTERELKYIFLLYDFDGPYAKMNFHDRKDKAALEAGYKKEKGGLRFDKNARYVLAGKNRRVQEAIGEFTIIQTAADREKALMDALNNQIDEIIKWCNTPKETADDMTKVVRIVKELPGILDTRKRIAELLQLREQTQEKEVTRSLSTLDEYNLERTGS